MKMLTLGSLLPLDWTLCCRELGFTVKNNDSFGQQTDKKCWAFEENKFSVSGHQFLLQCCPKLIKTIDKTQSIQANLKTKMNNIVQLGCLFSKLQRLFVNFPCVNVIFLLCYSTTME